MAAASVDTTDILVTFTLHGDETIVRLTHTALERLLDGEDEARGYATGWPPVIDKFAKMFG
jgi:hypothetical protein